MYNYSGGEAGLVNDISEGDVHAFECAYSNYHAYIYCFALKFIKSEEIAKEVVHDVFLKVWENRSTLNSELSFKGYLLTICKNQVLNLLKKAARETAFKSLLLNANYASHEETEVSVHYADYYEFALRAIALLPPQRRIVFQMCKLEGRTYEEVAERLGISKGTVRDHLFKATRQVKKYLTVHADITLALLCISMLEV